MRPIESSLVRRDVVVVVVVEPGIVGTRRSEVRGGGSGNGSFGSGCRRRSASRRRRKISSAEGNPNGPVLDCVPDVGIASSLGNVFGVVPLGGGCWITEIVGNCGPSVCSRASR